MGQVYLCMYSRELRHSPEGLQERRGREILNYADDMRLRPDSLQFTTRARIQVLHMIASPNIKVTNPRKFTLLEPYL